MAAKAPSDEQQVLFRHLQVDGLEVFVQKDLVQTASQVEVDLGGFWFLRWLRVRGLSPASSCAM